MIRVGTKFVEKYLENDWILSLIKEFKRSESGCSIYDKWLEKSPAKRAIYELLYRDLLIEGRQKILDVGGGITSLTSLLIDKNKYLLLDFLSHVNANSVDSSVILQNLVQQDWYNVEIKENYDIVLANDLFPNVDQRLSLFIEKVLPFTKEIRMSLTYYNNEKFYMTQRLDGDERLCVLAWDGNQIKNVLNKFCNRIMDMDFKIFDVNSDYVFSNKRQVCVVKLKGDRY